MDIRSLLQTAERYQRKARTWVRTSNGVLVLLIASMLIIVTSGFWFIRTEQQELSVTREKARAMRLARQNIMEMDQSILSGMLQRHTNQRLLEFERSRERVLASPPGSFPASVATASGSVPGPAAVQELTDALKGVSGLMLDQNWQGAADAYHSGLIADRLSQVVRAYRSDLDVIEARYTVDNRFIELTSLGVLLLQILTGLVSITAFMLALRRSGQEAKARTLAVNAANETRDQVERLFGMADMLQSATDYSDANAVLRSAASELLFGFSGALYVFNNSRDRLVLSTTWERDGFAPLTETLGLNQCWALKRGKPHINRPHSRKLCCEHHEGVDYALEIPMSARGEVLGLLQVYAQGDEAEERLIAAQGLATAIADAMSLALANIALREKLRGQALRDPLTGLYNRRYMEDTLQRFMRLSERENREFSVIMIDLDHFKRLNDQHGHAKGDAVLRDSAAAIINQLRESDVACRYGGEELIVLLPDCGLDMASTKAESIRISIEALSEPNGAQVSASIGVANFPSTSTSAKDLVAAADAALYQAKQSGRNRVVRSQMRTAPAGARRKNGHAAPASVAEAAE